MPENVFVLGLDERNLEHLRALPDASWYRFHQLLTIEELQHGDDIPLADLLDKAQRQLEDFDGSIDAIVGYWDFPVSTMVPLLRQRFGLPSAGLEAVVKCEHKYWSRLEQQKVIDEHPRFTVVELDTGAPEPPEELGYPFWLKPVKSFSSELAFKVEDRDGFQGAVEELRSGIGRVGEPFEFVLSHLDLPPEIAAIGGQACVAEEALRGQQATVEGYSLDGAVHVYGVVDSVMYPDSPSFLRYQYPSRLPGHVTERMADVARRVIRQVGLDLSTFNIEFFWDAERDALGLLEVNPRHSQSHAELFSDVDGLPNHHCMVRLALGKDPQLPQGRGRFGVAAKWFLRRFADGVVRRSPTPEEIERVQREVPGTTVDIVAEAGARLSDLPDQDSYSFELANVYVGADDHDELVAKYERCVALLPFEFDD